MTHESITLMLFRPVGLGKKKGKIENFALNKLRFLLVSPANILILCTPCCTVKYTATL